MAGLIAALFGGKSAPDTNPLPGIGGYDMPRGPYGEGGFPGSTPAAPPVHPQTAMGRRERQLTASQAQQEWGILPSRRVNGTPRQPYARNKAQADRTEVRSSPVLSAGVPGNENQRNTRYYGGQKAAPDGVNRYVFGGINGGAESYAVDRRIPYRIHARPPGYRGDSSVRGGDLSGQRYTMAAAQNLNQGGNGSFGISRQRGPNHRPVTFTRPGPWSANYYDVAPDTGTNAPNMIHLSPVASSRRTPARINAKAKASPVPRHNELEHRTSPAARGRSVRKSRHG